MVTAPSVSQLLQEQRKTSLGTNNLELNTNFAVLPPTAFIKTLHLDFIVIHSPSQASPSAVKHHHAVWILGAPTGESLQYYWKAVEIILAVNDFIFVVFTELG